MGRMKKVWTMSDAGAITSLLTKDDTMGDRYSVKLVARLDSDPDRTLLDCLTPDEADRLADKLRAAANRARELNARIETGEAQPVKVGNSITINSTGTGAVIAGETQVFHGLRIGG